MELPEGVRLTIILHYREGWSLRRIARALDWPESTLRTRLNAALSYLCDVVDVENLRTCPFIGGLLRWDEGTQARQAPRLAADLDEYMAVRAIEIEVVSECMSDGHQASFLRSKGPAWQQWEMRYLNRTGRTSMPSSAYNAGTAERYAHLS